MDWFTDRLREPSTWRGLIMIMTGGASAAVPPDLIMGVVTTGLTLSGVLGAATKGK
jgi:hypothetical protein